MQLRYDEDFIEAVVFLCASGRRKGIPPLQAFRFHRQREKLYAILDPEERNSAFYRLHLEWFREWGLETILKDLFNEFPRLAERLALLAVRQARGPAEDGAELYVDHAGRRTAVLALQPEAFARESALQATLRHELMHLNDMVDPAFGYSPALDLPGFNSAQQRLARERYRLLWDISIDGRLAAREFPPQRTRDQHAAAFDRAYSFWPEDRRTAAFTSLWTCPAPTHAGILDLIADPRGLQGSRRPAPGACCPLCDFPTFAWASHDRLPDDIINKIKTEFTAWLPAHGLCLRCLEAYEAACGCGANLTGNLS